MTVLSVLGTVGLTSCGNGAPAAGDNKVFFVGYLYDGATGMRLPKTAITSVSIEYRATTVTAKIEDDGRFITDEPLPTWQD